MIYIPFQFIKLINCEIIFDLVEYKNVYRIRYFLNLYHYQITNCVLSLIFSIFLLKFLFNSKYFNDDGSLLTS